MMRGENYPAIPQKGRLSDGWTAGDWERLTTAYNVWVDNQHLTPEDYLLCQDVFSALDVWDYLNREPYLGLIRRLYMERT